MYHPTEQCRQIIEAALAKDRSLLPPNVAIGVVCTLTLNNSQGQYTTLMSAASYLAYLGNHDASQWLQLLGANINWIAMGAAQGGHRDYAEELRAQGADINWIAMGAAQGGDRDYAEELRAKGADIRSIAMGAAQGGHRYYAEELREKGADIDWIANGAAQGGHRDYAELLRAHGADINAIARSAAQGGHRDYAEELRVHEADINAIAMGAAQGGHLNTEHSYLVWIVTICQNDNEVVSFTQLADRYISDEIKDKIRAQACDPIRLKQQLFRQPQDWMYALSLPSLAMSEDRAPYADVNLLRSIGPPDELRKFLDGVCRTTLFCQMAISSRAVADVAKALPNMPDELYKKILEGMLWLHIGEYSVQYQEAFSQMSLNDIFTTNYIGAKYNRKHSLFHRVTKFLSDNKLSS